MADRVFYPLVILIACGLIAAALAPGPARQREARQELAGAGDSVVARGATLNNLQTGDGIGFEPGPDEDGPGYIRARASKPSDVPPLSAGLFLSLSPAQERALAGRPLRVSVVARARGANPAEQFKFGYFVADERKDSGWETFTPTPNFETYSFTFTPEGKTGEPNPDYVGLWPDADGEGRTLDIAQIAVRPARTESETES